MIFVIILCALILLFAALTVGFFFFTFVRKGKESRIVFKKGDKDYFGEFYDRIYEGAQYIMSREFTEHYIDSFDGLKLYGRYLKNGESKKTVLLFHGYRSCGEKDFSGSFKYYVESCFDILRCDLRSHGKRKG